MIHPSISNRKLTDIALNPNNQFLARKTNRKRIEKQRKNYKKIKKIFILLSLNKFQVPVRLDQLVLCRNQSRSHLTGSKQVLGTDGNYIRG